MKGKKRRLAGFAAAMTALALSNGHIFRLPDFLAGFLVGLAITLMVFAALPDTTIEKLKRWKCHGK